MSTNDALPRWLRILFIAVSDAPMTNIKSINGEILTYATAAFMAAVLVLPVDIKDKDWLVYAWLGFLSGKVGFAFAGAWAKRATFKESPPAGQDIEDVAATTPTPPPEKAAPTLGKKDAQLAAQVLEARQRELADMEGA
jgi:hypothetical protein